MPGPLRSQDGKVGTGGEGYRGEVQVQQQPLPQQPQVQRGPQRCSTIIACLGYLYLKYFTVVYSCSSMRIKLYDETP